MDLNIKNSKKTSRQPGEIIITDNKKGDVLFSYSLSDLPLTSMPYSPCEVYYGPCWSRALR